MIRSLKNSLNLNKNKLMKVKSKLILALSNLKKELNFIQIKMKKKWKLSKHFLRITMIYSQDCIKKLKRSYNINKK